MSALLQSQQFSGIKSYITYFPENNINSIGMDNSELTGVFIPPSEVPGRPDDITGYFLAAANDEGKVQWVENPVFDLKLGDLEDVDTTGVTNGQVIVYNALTETWVPGDGGGAGIIPGEALSLAGDTLNVLFDNIHIGINGANQLEIIDPTIELTNAGGITITGSPVTLGGNIDIGVDGTVIRTTGGQTITGSLTMDSLVLRDNDTNIVTLEAPADVTTSYTVTLPAAQGAADTFLRNDGAGNLTWVEVVSSPAAPLDSIQFNNAGLFGGSANFTYDGTDMTITGGDSIAVNHISTSDIRLKMNIKPLEDPLELLEQINGYSYNWKSNLDTSVQYGVVAQELEEIGLGNLVKMNKDGYKGVKYNNIIPFLIESIKVLNKRVKSLEQV
jgi:hypothetical protein